MKTLITLLVSSVILLSCKKEITSSSSNMKQIETIKMALKANLTDNVFRDVNFTKAQLMKIDSINFQAIKIPFETKSGMNFILLKTNNEGKILNGKIVTLTREESVHEKKQFIFNGSLIIRSLNNEILVNEKIRNGRRLKLKKDREVQMLSFSQPEPSPSTLPDVIVVGDLNQNGGMTLSEWMNLQSILGELNSFNYYFPAGTSGSSYYTDETTSGGANSAPVIEIGFETSVVNQPISIESYLKCFSQIPDAGAVYSVELFTDLPVDGDPSMMFNWETESPGHTFLQIKKSNGSNSVIQNIGFYPQTNWKTMLTPAPVEGKFVDNSGHEFNASIKMQLTQTKFQEMLTQIRYLSNSIKYDIDEYNCTDFALEVFNSIRHTDNKVLIPRYDIPGGMAPNGSYTPQGLFKELSNLKLAGSSEATNILIPGFKGWVAESHGPCN
ncbi:MAG: hypothetical protein V4717_14500 [Bacteroidota bacterium]